MDATQRARPAFPVSRSEPELRRSDARGECAHGHLPSGAPAPEPRRLIVLDDDPAMGRFIGEVAGGSGFETTVTTEPAAFQAALRDEQDVVILDLMLPGTDGVAMVHGLAAHKPKSGLILVSGLDARILESASSVARSLGLSVIGHLQKPFRAAALRELLARTSVEGVPVSAAPRARCSSAAELLEAIDAGRIVVHYQPQVALSDRAWVGAEALVRWQHPTFGLIGPDAFLGAASDPTTSLLLTEHVLRTAAADWTALCERTGRDLTISVNVPAEVLTVPEMVERVRRIVDAAGLPCDMLTIEVTEDRLSLDAAAALETLTRLRVMGFGLSIDDFGTGHSSLERLHRVPFTELKVDRQFIRGIATDPWARTIVAQSIALGRELELTTVAEGIEDASTWDWLAAAGADLAQGFHVARPAAIGTLETWSDGWEAPRSPGVIRVTA